MCVIQTQSNVTTAAHTGHLLGIQGCTKGTRRWYQIQGSRVCRLRSHSQQQSSKGKSTATTRRSTTWIWYTVCNGENHDHRTIHWIFGVHSLRQTQLKQTR